MTIAFTTLQGTSVSYGNSQSFLDFINRNAILHDQIFQASSSLGITYPKYPLYQYSGDHWIAAHDLEHRAINAALGLPAPYNLDDLNFNSKKDFDDWVYRHKLEHQAIENGINNFSAVTPAGFFKTGNYTGTGAAATIASGIVDDMILFYSLANSAPAPRFPLFDTNRGAKVYVDETSGSNPQVTDNQSVTAFGSTGFNLGTSAVVNNSGTSYQYFSWTNGAMIMNIVNYTGTGAAHTISHNLGVIPQMIMVINGTTGGGYGTILYHAFMDNTSPAHYSFNYNGAAPNTTSRAASTSFWNDTTPTNLLFTVGTNDLVNHNGANYTAYLFGSVSGQSAFGKYTGNGNNVGPIVNLGFQPSGGIICKQNASNNDPHFIFGNSASLPFDAASGIYDTTNYVNLTSTGFSVMTTSDEFNTNATPYWYSFWK